MYILDSGRLKQRVTIQAYETVINSIGADDERLVDIARAIPAEVKPMRGKEQAEYYRNANTVQYKVTIRYRSNVAPNMTLKYKNRIFDIHSVLNVDEANIVLELICTEQIAKEKRLKDD